MDDNLLGSNFPSILRLDVCLPRWRVLRIDSLQNLEEKCKAISASLNFTLRASNGFLDSHGAELRGKGFIAESFARKQPSCSARGQARPGRVDVTHGTNL